MKLPIMLIGGDVHLSRETIKRLLEEDFDFPITSAETEEGYEAVKTYIADLIHRLNHIKI